MKHIKFFVTCILVLAMNSVFAAKKSEPLDSIAAVVNDGVITQSELNQTIDTLKKQMQASNNALPPADVIHKQVLDQLITKKLQLQLADQMNIHVSDTDVDKAIGTIAENNHISTKELYQKVNEQGLTTADYRKEIHDQMVMQQVQQQAVGSKIMINPQEVDEFMRSKTWQSFNTKEYHLEDILIALPDTPSSQDVTAAKNRADEIANKIRHGGLNFHDAAAAESGDKNALQGGDLGWRKLPEIPSAFASQLVHMQANEILGPVQTSNGFHIVHLAGIRSATGKMTADQQRTQVQQLIFQRKMEENLQTWVAKMRSEAFINTNPEG